MTSRRVRSNGCWIHYQDVGDSGDAILLLHGFGSSSNVWFQQGYVDALAGRRIVAVDLLGHVASDKPHDAERYGNEMRAADLVAVLDHAGIARAHAWGYSMGGRNAYGFAALAPARCASLIVGGAAPEQAGEHWEQGWLDRRADALDRGDWPHFWTLMGGPPGEAYREQFERNDPLALAAASRGLREWPVGSADYLTLPSLHYVGSRDPFADRVRTAAELMGGAFVEIEGADHLSATKHVPEIVAAVKVHIEGAGVVHA